jgi:hypothetical protein
MISLKDIPMLIGLASTAIGGGVYIHDLRRDVTELGADYRQHVAEQQETTLYEKKWQLEKRVNANPNDVEAKEDLEITIRLLEKNKGQQDQLRRIK